MKILFISDEESKKYWDFFDKNDFKDIDLIISCGDLKAEYLTFLATMVPVPVLYVHGNHDHRYGNKPPEGCICIDDYIFEYEGVRILGLGGSYRYKPGNCQYTEQEMEKRVHRLRFKLRRKGGFDILVTHAPAFGHNDGEDTCHKGFEVFNTLIEKYQPKLFVHGHVHMNYGGKHPRESAICNTKVINAYEKYIVDLDK